ncbi:MAG: winged helix-turn-helix transcriptional regulator [Geodermatophilaceae bacterium]|nr:winged helix-turn-helix transcriptional regulator [Geodermatophilaceae bacterium]
MDLPNHYAGPLDSPGYWLWHAALRWTAALTDVLRELELTPVQFFALGGLAWLTTERDSGVSQRALSDHTGLDASMLSRVLRGLEDRGLVRREPDIADARAHRVQLTGKARELLVRAKPLVVAADRRFFGGLANLGAVEFRQLLEQLTIDNAKGSAE